MEYYLGIDPGKSGAIAVLGPAGACLGICKLNQTPKEINDFIEELKDNEAEAGLRAVMERVHAMPGQGVSSVFRFGESYGFLRGALVANRIPFELCSPGVWQRRLGCLSRGDKNVTKQRAQEMFPNEKVTHATADALLIAEYCRRNSLGLWR